MKSLNRWSSCVAVAAAVAFVAPIASAGDLTLEVSGECPGQLTLRWSGAEPNLRMAILYGERLGQSRSIRVCEGTWLGMSGIQLVRVIPTGTMGTGSVSGHAPQNACGGYLQLMVLDGGYECPTSNIEQIPE